jgi:hypothetical protein
MQESNPDGPAMVLKLAELNPLHAVLKLPWTRILEELPVITQPGKKYFYNQAIQRPFL